MAVDIPNEVREVLLQGEEVALAASGLNESYYFTNRRILTVRYGKKRVEGYTTCLYKHIARTSFYPITAGYSGRDVASIDISLAGDMFVSFLFKQNSIAAEVNQFILSKIL